MLWIGIVWMQIRIWIRLSILMRSGSGSGPTPGFTHLGKSDEKIWLQSTAMLVYIILSFSSATYQLFGQLNTKFLEKIVLWIRIRIRIRSGLDPDSVVFPESISGSRRAKMAQKNRKELLNFIFWRAGCSPLRAKGFSCSLDVLYGCLGIIKLKFLIKKDF